MTNQESCATPSLATRSGSAATNKGAPLLAPDAATACAAGVIIGGSAVEILPSCLLMFFSFALKRLTQTSICFSCKERIAGVGEQTADNLRYVLPDPLSELRVQAESIRIRDASQVRFIECWVTSNVGDGWSKARFRHKREVKPHQQLRHWHELENGAELG